MERLWLKNYTVNPSWSFKDRVVSVAIARARQFGFQAIACASTGNLANAVAAHAASARHITRRKRGSGSWAKALIRAASKKVAPGVVSGGRRRFPARVCRRVTYPRPQRMRPFCGLGSVPRPVLGTLATLCCASHRTPSAPCTGSSPATPRGRARTPSA